MLICLSIRSIKRISNSVLNSLLLMLTYRSYKGNQSLTRKPYYKTGFDSVCKKFLIINCKIATTYLIWLISS
jgi:hypothetical protein